MSSCHRYVIMGFCIIGRRNCKDIYVIKIIGPGQGEKVTEFGSLRKSDSGHISPLPHRQTHRVDVANGRSRQRTCRIRCHRLHLSLGHVQYAYSSFLETRSLCLLT